jgi:hypothetical protein
MAIDRTPWARDRLGDIPVGKIEQTEDPLAVPSSLKGQDRLTGLNQCEITYHERKMPFSPCDKPPEHLQNGMRIFFLFIDGKSQML